MCRMDDKIGEGDKDDEATEVNIVLSSSEDEDESVADEQEYWDLPDGWVKKVERHLKVPQLKVILRAAMRTKAVTNPKVRAYCLN